MGFGQQSGPPASAKQIQELLDLLHDAGHSDFRDARGPMGFTQRQAGGRFTRDEVATFIDRLSEADGDVGGPPTGLPAAPPADDRPLRHFPAERLAAELERRGWIVIGPSPSSPEV